jgi:hypothetical protein
MESMRSAKRAVSTVGICLALVACGGDSAEKCSLLDGTDLAKDYKECVATGGKVTPAGSGHAAFCTLDFAGGTTKFQQCRTVGGDTYNWDCFCPGNFSGGEECFLFYPENACPVTAAPDAQSPMSMPPCNCP